jgi:hypothetical protein
MAGPFYVDSEVNAGGTPDGLSWAAAFDSFWSLPTLASGEIVYVASRHVEPSVGGNKTLTCPTSGAPALIYSVTTNTTTYAPGAQVKTTGGNYTLTIDGAHAVYGVTFEAGYAGTNAVAFISDNNEYGTHYGCTYKGASGFQVIFSGIVQIILPTIDLANDSSGASNPILSCSPNGQAGETTIIGGAVTNATNRTGTTAALFTTGSSVSAVRWMGGDLSALPSACELHYGGATLTAVTLENCKMPSTYTLLRSAISGATGPSITLVNCENADSTSERIAYKYSGEFGTIDYEKTVVMTDTNKATADDGAGGTQDFSWKMVSTAGCTRHQPLASPWFYVPITSTGSKNLDVYFGAAETLDNEEIAIEVQYLGTSGVELFTHVSSGVVANAAAGTYATTGGTWAATVTEEYYARQTVAINEVGLARARAVVGAASKTIYVNPRIIVS